MADDDELARPADGYEDRYMAGEGRVLHRDKMVGNWKWHSVLLGPMLLSGAAILPWMAMDGAPAVAMLTVAGIIAASSVPIWLLFSVLRITVSTEKLHVQFGLWGPEIPIAAIRSVEVIDYDWKTVGYGIKYRGDSTWQYNMIGDAGVAVKIVWVDDGKKKTTILSSHDPGGLAAAIRQARAEQGAGMARDAALYQEEQRRDPKARVEVDGERGEQEAVVEVPADGTAAGRDADSG